MSPFAMTNKNTGTDRDRGRAAPRWQRGAIGIMAVFMLPILLGFTGLAVDVAYLLVVRGELQNATDAAVLAGSVCLIPSATCGNVGHTLPDFTTATAKVIAAITALNNPAGGQSLTSGTVQVGYKNLTGTPSGLQATTITPGPDDVPVVKLTISKENGKNGGAVAFYFAQALGLTSAAVTTVASAAPTSFKQVAAGRLFPIIMTSCLFDNYWTNNTPTIDPVTAKPYIFSMGDGAGIKADPLKVCDSSGIFTSFTVDNNSASYVKGLINNGSNTTLSLQDKVYLQPGAKASNYGNINDCSAAGDKTCEYVLVAVAQGVLPTSKQFYPIKAFACIRILSANQGGKTIQAQMVSNTDQATAGKCPTNAPDGTPATPGAINSTYGVVTPRLVQ